MVIFSKIVGSTFCKGQEEFKHMSKGDVLTLKRDRENKHDINAIGVHNFLGVRLGYLKAELSRDIASLLDAGSKFDCEVINITGVFQHQDNLGCNIQIKMADTPVMPVKDKPVMPDKPITDDKSIKG